MIENNFFTALQGYICSCITLSFSMFNFEGILEKYENNLWNYHVKVPEVIVLALKEKGVKRFLCSIDKGDPFHASLMPAGNGIYFIKLNQELRKRHRLSLGRKMLVSFTEDESKYGMPMPEEFEEILRQDDLSQKRFEKLSPGKQRSLLYLVNKVKNPQKRLEKSLIILEHLVEQKGELDFKKLHQDFKDKKGMV